MSQRHRVVLLAIVGFRVFCTPAAALAQGMLPPGFLEARAREDRESRIRGQIGQLDARIRSSPSGAAPLLERAQLHGQLGEMAPLISDLEAAVRLSRNDPETLFRAGTILVEHDPVAAVSYFDRVLERVPENVSAVVSRGRARGMVGDVARAHADFDAALERDPGNALALALKGNLMLQAGAFREAIALFTRSLDREPTAAAYFDRAFCHQGVGDYHAAVADYTAAYDLDRSNVGAICERGQANQLAGAYRLAVRDFEECTARVPGNVQAALQLAWVLATCPEAGVRDGRRALGLAAEICDPVTCRSPEPLTVLAAACAEVGDFPRAEKLQARAVAMSSFSGPLRESSARRLKMIAGHEPVRESAPLRIEPRAADGPIRSVTVDEALAFPADVLGFEMLDVELLLEMCVLSRAGATIHAAIGGQTLTMTADTVDAIEPRLRERRDVFEQAIRRRGFATLAEGYTAARRGDCDNWEIGDARVLVEQDGFRARLAQGVVRHRAIVVESAVVLMHDSNTDIRIPGEITHGVVTFVTAAKGGVGGMATERCALVLTPAKVTGKAWAEPFAGRAIAHRNYGEYREALADFERSLECDRRPEFASLEAVLLATCPDEAVRDGRRAVEAALVAKRLSGKQLPDIVLSALAVSHAEVGDFEAAIRYQRQLIGRAPDDDREFLREQLALFEAGRPFHEDVRP